MGQLMSSTRMKLVVVFILAISAVQLKSVQAVDALLEQCEKCKENDCEKSRFCAEKCGDDLGADDHSDECLLCVLKNPNADPNCLLCPTILPICKEIAEFAHELPVGGEKESEYKSFYKTDIDTDIY